MRNLAQGRWREEKERLTSTPTVPDITTLVNDVSTVGVSAVPCLCIPTLGVGGEVRVGIRVVVAAFGVSAVCVAADGGTAVTAFV